MGLFDPSSWFLSAEDVAAGQRADETLDRLNREAWESGKISGKEYERRSAAIMTEGAGTYPAQIDGAFDEGWREGEQNVADTVKGAVSTVTGTVASVIGAPVKGVLLGLPWWAWLVGVIGVLAYLGLLPGIAQSLVKRIKV